MSYEVPNEADLEILRKLGIDPDGVVVARRAKDGLQLLHLKTRCEINIWFNRYMV